MPLTAAVRKGGRERGRERKKRERERERERERKKRERERSLVTIYRLSAKKFTNYTVTESPTEIFCSLSIEWSQH